MKILLYFLAVVGAVAVVAGVYIAGAYWCWSQGQKNRSGAELSRGGLWNPETRTFGPPPIGKRRPFDPMKGKQ